LMSELGEFDDAKEKLENALAIATETGNRQGIAKWRGELGVHHLLAGDADGASQQLLRCLAVAREIGYSRYEAWAQIYLGAVGMERDLDRLDEARERIEQGLEIADDLGNEEIRIAGLFQLGRLERAAGDRVRALETLELADRLATATQNLRLRARIRLELEVV